MRPLGAAFLSLAWLATPAHAADLEWSAPAACPDSDEVRFRVERAIGMPLSHAAPLRFVVQAGATARGYAASIEVADARQRRRTLVAAACAELVDMVTVTVALALGADGSGAADEWGAASPPVVAEAGTNAVPISGSADRAASEARSPDSEPVGGDSTLARTAWSPALALWLLGDSGSLPRPGGGIAFEARIEHARIQLRAVGSWYRRQHEALPDLAAPAPGAALGLMTGALALCAVPFGAPAAPLRGLGCVGWELGRLSGEGTRVRLPRDGAALWSAPTLDVGASLALGATSLRAGAMLTLALPLARESFVLGDLGTVHRPPGVVGRVALGLEWTMR